MMSAAIELAMLRCAACGRLDTAPREVCAACLGTRLEPARVPGTGRLATWTTIRRAPARFREDAPYDIAVVDLDAGLRVTGRLAADSAAPTAGARVEAIDSDRPYPLFTMSTT